MAGLDSQRGAPPNREVRDGRVMRRIWYSFKSMGALFRDVGLVGHTEVNLFLAVG